jgi:hypothetical protein
MFVTAANESIVGSSTSEEQLKNIPATEVTDDVLVNAPTLSKEKQF